jgi:hypothetical protein
MAGSRVKWYGGKVRKELSDEMNRRLRLVGERLASKVRRNISTSTRSAGPSAPGEFPHADTGNLRKSIVYDHRPEFNEVDVGSAVEYAEYLEHNMHREFLTRTLEEELPMIKSILTKPMPGRAGGGRISIESINFTDGGDE